MQQLLTAQNRNRLRRIAQYIE